ncbi:hypothetical protein HK097_000392, partial [Rhizophlyctis rosea]
MIALFHEHGPFTLTSDSKLKRNPHTWNDKYHLLFVDNPVGVGFSSVEPKISVEDAIKWRDGKEGWAKSRDGEEEEEEARWERGYTVNQKAVSEDLITFLRRFYEAFPKVADSELWLTGE